MEELYEDLQECYETRNMVRLHTPNMLFIGVVVKLGEERIRLASWRSITSSASPEADEDGNKPDEPEYFVTSEGVNVVMTQEEFDSSDDDDLNGLHFDTKMTTISIPLEEITIIELDISDEFPLKLIKFCNTQVDFLHKKYKSEKEAQSRRERRSRAAKNAKSQ